MGTSGLIIRENERHEVSLPILVRVAHAHRDAVRYARGVTDEHGWLAAHLIDFSIAGVGFVSEVFLPRGTTYEIRIPDPDAGSGGPLFEGVVRIMRIQMMDRRPAYLIGSAFADQGEDLEGRVGRIIERFTGEVPGDA